MKKLGAVVLALGLSILFTATEASAEMHIVNKGDNLWEISQKYNTTIDDLITINKLDSTLIRPDQKLALYETYDVVEGDTLYWIAKDYDTTVDEIKELNDLTSSLILIGQELKVPKSDEGDSSEGLEKVPQRQTAKQSETVNNEPVSTKESPEGKTMTVTATAYTAECEGCSGITYTGVNLLEDRNKKVIAVDPNVIPLGTKVYVEGYGYAVAEDIGGAIKGNRIDIHVPTKEEAYSWGVKDINITIIE